MDTPERGKFGGGTPMSSKAEDSPLFHFINSLSPIEPVKSTYSAHSLQAYQPLNITSISSIFTSPHDNSQESRLLRRNSFAELSENEVCPDSSDKSKLCKTASNSIRLFACTSIARETRRITCSVNEALVDPPDGCSDFPPSVQFDIASPDHNTTPCHGVRPDLKHSKGRAIELVHTAQNSLEKRKCLFAMEVNVPGSHQPDKSKDETVGCDWENLIAPNADDPLIFDPSTEQAQTGVQLAVNNAESCGLLPSKVTEGGDINKAHPTASNPVNCHELVMKEDETDHTPQMFSGGQSKILSSEEIQGNLYEATGCIPLGYKVETQHQRGMRRRCLVFDAAGYSQRSMQKGAVQDSSASMSKGKMPSENRLNLGKTPSPRVLRGIGLHLNALALTPKDKMAMQDPLATGEQLTSVSCSTGLLPASTTEDEIQGKVLPVGDDSVHSGSEFLELEVYDDSSPAHLLGDDKSSSQSSPQKKRRKADNGEDGEACKRCSCKKSKCLKLYCECFAAGVYCSEPCTCQGCLNKPIHEEIVLSTRKQIEFRNPLAFAPKVIRTSDTGQEMGDDSSNTPASARHKRGCNCKKSSCLKKYCECYQGGVGCSTNCRCEGCKNTFGKRDGAMPMDTEEMKPEREEKRACGKEEENEQQKANVQNQENRSSELVPITPPFDASRALVKLPNFSSAKPPRPSKIRTSQSFRASSSKALLESEMELTHSFSKATDNGFNDDTPDMLRDGASSISCIKTSPNGKRVSPPHNAISISPSRKGGRKLILKSIPSFPSLMGDTYNEPAMNNSGGPFS